MCKILWCEWIKSILCPVDHKTEIYWNRKPAAKETTKMTLSVELITLIKVWLWNHLELKEDAQVMNQNLKTELSDMSEELGITKLHFKAAKNVLS